MPFTSGLGLFALLLFSSCGPSVEPIPSGEAPPPDALRAEAWAQRPIELLTSASRAVEDTPLAERLPTDAPTVLSQLVERADALARLAASDGPLGLVILGPRDRVVWVARTRPLSTEERGRLVLSPAAVPWAQRVSVRGRAGDPAAAFAGAWMVLADDRAALDAALPYLVRTMARRRTSGAATSLLLRFPDSAAPDALRPALDARRRALVRDARESARNERERHRLPPSIGDPEVLVEELDRVTGRRLSLLRDLGAGSVVVSIDDDAIVVSIDAAVRAADTPLGRALEGERPEATRWLGAAPAISAIAWSGAATDAERRETSDALLDAATRTSGARLTTEERERWRATLAAIDGAVGDTRMVSIGPGDRGERTWSVSFAPRDVPTGVTAARALAATLSQAHLAEVVGSLAGCVAPATPSAPTAPASGSIAPSDVVARPDGDGAQVVCRADPSERDSLPGALGWSIRAGAGAIAWASSEDDAIGLASSVRESRSARSRASIAGDDPDAARWLDGQRDAFFALGVSPAALVRFARGRAGPPPRDRALLVLARTPRGLAVRARIPVRAVLSTLALARSLAAD